MKYGLGLAPMKLLERLLLLIAASTLLTEVAFPQGATIASLSTQDTPGTPTTVRGLRARSYKRT